MSVDDNYLAKYVKSNLLWVGCDRHNHLAVFEAAGYAPMTDSVWSSDEDRLKIIDHLKQRELISEVKRHGKIDFNMIETSKAKKAIEAWSQRGISYYSPPNDGMRSDFYECVVSPVIPLKIMDLPIDLQENVRRSRLPLRFADAERIPFDLVGKHR